MVQLYTFKNVLVKTYMIWTLFSKKSSLGYYTLNIDFQFSRFSEGVPIYEQEVPGRKQLSTDSSRFRCVYSSIFVGYWVTLMGFYTKLKFSVFIAPTKIISNRYFRNTLFIAWFLSLYRYHKLINLVWLEWNVYYVLKLRFRFKTGIIYTKPQPLQRDGHLI